jgi:type II secretory pathway component GspD/PulD (secretin)/beta-lactamase regulating signal transducer with metallopeptidase domain
MSLLENLFSQGTTERLGWMLVHFLWQAAVVALLLAAMLRLLRNAGANLRYAVACSALAMIVALPLVTIRFVEVPGPVAEAGPVPADLPPPTTAPAVETATEVLEEMPASAPARTQVQAPTPLETADVTMPVVPLRERIVSALEPALPYLVLGWVIGVFGLSTWHLGGWTQLQRLKRRMVREVGSPLQGRLADLSARLGVHRAVRLLESAVIEVPTVVGWLRPVILLPASALTGLRPEQLEAILAHELAHVRRHDYLVNLLQTVVEILGFYHPAVWWVSRRIRIERENCCDDLAVQVCGSSLQYARALACMEEIRHNGADLAMATTGGSLMARIARLLGRPTVDDRRFAWLPGLVALLLVVGIIIPAALVLATPQAPQTVESAVSPAAAVPGDLHAASTGADRNVADPNTKRMDSESANTPSDSEAAQVLLSFKTVKVWSDLRPDRETLLLMANTLGGESRLARELRRPDRKLDMTMGEVLKRYVVPQSLSQQAGQALLDLLQSRGYMTVLSQPQVVTRDGRPARIGILSAEHFQAAPDSPSGLVKIEYGTAVNVTTHVVDSNRVTLEMMAELTDAVPGPEDGNQPRVSRTSAQTTVTARNDQYLIWAAVESVAGQAAQDGGKKSLYILVKPSIQANATSGSRIPTASPSRTLRQVLLDVRTVTLEGSDLSNLTVEWSQPTTRAGMSPGPSAGGVTGGGGAGAGLQGVRLGYTPDQTFTESLLAALDALQKNHQATVSSQQILAQDGHQSQVKALREEWWTITIPAAGQSAPSHVERHKTETGTVVTVTPHIGDSNDILLEMAVEVSDSLPKAQGSDVPLITRRTAKNSVTVRDGGTVALAGMTANRAGPNDKSVRETAIFVTAHLVHDVNETPVRAPQAPSPDVHVAPAMPLTPEQIASARREYVNYDPIVQELARRIVKMERELIVAQQTRTSAHPDVAQAQALLEALKKSLEEKRKQLEQEFDKGLTKRMGGPIGDNVESRQKATITATFTNADLLSVLAEISKCSGVKITPDATVKPTSVTTELVEASPEAALQQVLKDTAYIFRKSDDSTYLVFRPLSNSFQGTDLAQVLQDLAGMAGVPIVPDPNVTGLVSVTFDSASLDEVLQMVLAGKPYVVKKMPRYYLVADRSIYGRPFIDVSETRRIRLRYIQAPRAKTLLSPVLAQYVQADLSNPRDPNDQGNTLMITAPPSLIDRITQEIRQIDRYGRQVLLDARVVVMEPGDLKNLPVVWGWPTSSSKPAPMTNIQWGYAPDRSSTDSLMMTLNQLLENSRADSIANPKVVAQDGRRARMGVVQEEWFMMTTPNNSDSFYHSRTELQKIESGTVLTITPYIGDNNDIMLEMAVEVSDSIPKARGSDLPLVTRRRAQNSITVKDGGTVAVGGLAENRSKSSDKRVPLLSQVPLVGELFKNRNRDKASREIAVFVTAHLVPEGSAVAPSPPQPAKPAVRVPTDADVHSVPADTRGSLLVDDGREKKQTVWIGARFLTPDERLLKDLQGDRPIRGVTSPQDTRVLHEIGKRMSGSEPLVLDDTQADLLIDAAKNYRDSAMLSSPKLRAFVGEQASVLIGQQIPYTAGYDEPNSPGGEPRARQATLQSGVKFDVLTKPALEDAVIVDGTLRVTTFHSFEQKKYKGRYSYQVPRTDEVVLSLNGPPIPEGRTLFVPGPKARLDSRASRAKQIWAIIKVTKTPADASSDPSSGNPEPVRPHGE